jgi:hypothetical protein
MSLEQHTTTVAAGDKSGETMVPSHRGALTDTTSPARLEMILVSQASLSHSFFFLTDFISVKTEPTMVNKPNPSGKYNV